MNGSLQLILLSGRADVSSLLSQFLEHRVFDRFITDERLLRRAQRAVIETFSGKDIRDSLCDIGGLFDVGWDVAGPDTERRFSSAIGGFDETGTASGKDQRCQLVFHQFLCAFHSWQLHAGNHACGRAGALRGVRHQTAGFVDASGGRGVRAEDNNVSPLNCD